MKYYRLLDSDRFDYGTLVLDTEIPTKYVNKILSDALEEAHNICDWCVDDLVERLPKEWNPRVIYVDIFYI